MKWPKSFSGTKDLFHGSVCGFCDSQSMMYCKEVCPYSASDDVLYEASEEDDDGDEDDLSVENNEAGTKVQKTEEEEYDTDLEIEGKFQITWKTIRNDNTEGE